MKIINTKQHRKVYLNVILGIKKPNVARSIKGNCYDSCPRKVTTG